MDTISSIGWGSHQIFFHLSSPPSYASPSTIPHKTNFVFNKHMTGDHSFFSIYESTDLKIACPSPIPSPRPVRVQSGCWIL